MGLREAAGKLCRSFSGGLAPYKFLHGHRPRDPRAAGLAPTGAAGGFCAQAPEATMMKAFMHAIELRVMKFFIAVPTKFELEINFQMKH